VGFRGEVATEGDEEESKGQLELISSFLLLLLFVDSLELRPGIYTSLPRFKTIHEYDLLPILDGFLKLHEDGSNLAMVRRRVESGQTSRGRGRRERRESSSRGGRGSRRASKRG